MQAETKYFLSRDGWPALASLTSDAALLMLDCDHARLELVFTHAPPHWITVRVGHCRNSAASYYLQQQSQVRDLLLLLNIQKSLAKTLN